MKFCSANKRSRNSDFNITLTHMINLILNISRPIEISYIRVCEEVNQYYFFSNFKCDISEIALLCINIRKQLCMEMAVITQLDFQLYITCQLHVSANTIFGHHHVGYNYRRKLHNIWYSITISVGVSRGGRDLILKRIGECVCRRFNM